MPSNSPAPPLLALSHLHCPAAQKVQTVTRHPPVDINTCSFSPLSRLTIGRAVGSAASEPWELFVPSQPLTVALRKYAQGEGRGGGENTTTNRSGCKAQKLHIQVVDKLMVAGGRPEGDEDRKGRISSGLLLYSFPVRTSQGHPTDKSFNRAGGLLRACLGSTRKMTPATCSFARAC
jgi:hypothetical protein